MHWRFKSAVQRACSALPFGSEAIYYTIQRHFGNLKNPTPPWVKLEAAAGIGTWLSEVGASLVGRRVIEVGTGRGLDLPLGLYLSGAASVDTFDLHGYLKPELVSQAVDFIRQDKKRVEDTLHGSGDIEALRTRLKVVCEAHDVPDLMRKTNIRYHAPADAAATGLPAGSIDLHVSFTVFEHIPAEVLTGIFREARRVLSPQGLALYYIDLSDHFSHDDHSISAINFLQFSDEQWHSHAGNQFAYHNRRRSPEYKTMLCDYEILRWQERIDSRSLKLLETPHPVSPQFVQFSREELCCTDIRVLARPLP